MGKRPELEYWFITYLLKMFQDMEFYAELIDNHRHIATEREYNRWRYCYNFNKKDLDHFIHNTFQVEELLIDGELKKATLYSVKHKQRMIEEGCLLPTDVGNLNDYLYSYFEYIRESK
jgi:hypothetical protein